MRAGRSRGGEFRKERYAGFVLGCASLTVADIDKGIQLLAAVLAWADSVRPPQGNNQTRLGLT